MRSRGAFLLVGLLALVTLSVRAQRGAFDKAYRERDWNAAAAATEEIRANRVRMFASSQEDTGTTPQHASAGPRGDFSSERASLRSQSERHSERPNTESFSQQEPQCLWRLYPEPSPSIHTKLCTTEFS
jgi:Tfp pilus assembly protein PilV